MRVEAALVSALAVGSIGCSHERVIECFADSDCEPIVCDPSTACCNEAVGCASGRCVKYARSDVSCTTQPPRQGWDDPPAMGPVFVVNQIAIASKDQGFDLDGNCDPATGEGCVDNKLWLLGELGNDQIRQGLLGGESLLIVELAGLDSPYEGDDPSLTVKLYAARDADDPFFPANNFRIPPGHTTCCEFKIAASSLDDGVAKVRLPARIDHGRLSSTVNATFAPTLTETSTAFPAVSIVQPRLISARVPAGQFGPGQEGVQDGLLGAVAPINRLAVTPNPYCFLASAGCSLAVFDDTLLEVVVADLGGPDIDVDHDGLEAVLDVDGDGHIDRCCDGNGQEPAADAEGHCLGKEVPPTDPSQPWTCALDPRIADGYSVSITFTAVGARVVGVAP
jgi:hypothetical protein